MKLLPLKSRAGIGKRGPAPLKRGMAASFSLIVAGLAGALVYALACGQNSVWLSPFCTWWVALSCGAGGLLAGLRGGPGAWWPAGRIGVLGGGLVLALFALVAPESLGYGDLGAYVLLPAVLSCAGALTGANLTVRSARQERSARQARSARPRPAERRESGNSMQ